MIWYVCAWVISGFIPALWMFHASIRRDNRAFLSEDKLLRLHIALSLAMSIIGPVGGFASVVMAIQYEFSDRYNLNNWLSRPAFGDKNVH